MKSKIHRGTVTETRLDYQGSLTLDADLIAAANLVEHEKVHVLSVDTGARFETYVIAGAAGSGEICLNGAAARLGQVGDIVIIVSYASVEPAELPLIPAVVHVDRNNRITNDAPATGDLGLLEGATLSGPGEASRDGTASRIGMVRTGRHEEAADVWTA